MITKRTFSKSRGRWRIAGVTAAGIAALAAGSTIAGAFNPQPDPPKGLGMIGVVEGQTLRLSAVNLATARAPARACRVLLGFADLEARPVGSPAIKNLAPGRAAFVDLRAAGIGNPSDGGRAQLRPVATTIGRPAARVCRVVVSVELFGPAGAQTDVYIGDPADG